ncbi:hypothetical protein K438DRAFT_1616889 [Mycena galopus ATCC 62051]|nr:hypothetical protein K438DRAFT_1616889 [Mycena galopus ATCC 62051]
MSVAALLVQHGVFPGSPTKIQTGVSIDLLEIYRALFERSCDAITALAAALETIYEHRGFRVPSQKNSGHRAVDAFRKSLTQAVLWYTSLRDRMQARVEHALSIADNALAPPAPFTPPPLTPGRASRILHERCPACFGLEEWGRPLRDGGDVQFGADGCFSYWHLRAAGDGPIKYNASYFVSKERVAEVQTRITAARKTKPSTHPSAIPQEAIDACQESWDAANEKKRKADPKRYDSSGVFVLTCRHSQVLFLCDIDTPGEQQKYIVALMEEANSHLPPEATILQAYDVGCVTDHSLHLFPILTEGFRERVGFIINAMHTFGHQWVCQLVYSPRMRRGAGISDHEGVERFWSCIRKLIPLTRSQWKSRRIWTIDQYTAFVNDEGRRGLGAWTRRQETKNLITKRKQAIKILRQCGVPEAELRHEWELQKAAQTSIHAPMCLRRELDKVLKLQEQIDVVENTIAEAKQSITSGGANASHASLVALRGLETTHEVLSAQAEALYASLNISTTFPELKGLPLDFVRTLLIMRNLKINIRRIAVGSFYEWETLNRAVAGQREALGTKLHQATRKAISKRTPTLLKSIKKFNNHCADLKRLRPQGLAIPIPTALPTQLSGLRDDAVLYEDVWITPSTGVIPRWLDDVDVRDGIRSLHALDRCNEEAARLDMERGNMRQWLAHELAVVAHAMEDNSDDFLEHALRLRQQQLLDLELEWQLPQQAQMATFLRESVLGIPSSPASRPTASCLTAPASRPTAVSTSGGARAKPASISSTSTPTNPLEPEEGLFEEYRADSMEDVDSGEISYVGEPLLVQEMAEMMDADIDDMEEISSSDAGRLNSFGLNGIAGALLNVFERTSRSAGLCALLSTYDLPRVRFKASDEELWRNWHHTQYWDKRLWLLPIHRLTDEHWVFVVVSLQQQQLFFFDSLGQRKGWRRDIRDTMVLITRMVVLANRHGHPLHVSTEEDAWIARPLFHETRRLQYNDFDCGVWVLGMIASVLRGFHTNNLTEALMPQFRALLMDMARTLPFQTRRRS